MNFKKTMLASLLMISASGAFAADTATLTVNGTIAPTSCNITIGGGANGTLTFDVADYIGAEKTLDPQDIPFDVSCDPNAIAVSLNVTDEKRSDSGGQRFSLGMHGSSKIGDYGLVLANMMADSAPARMLSQTSDGVWRVVGSGFNGAGGVYAFANMTSTSPVLAKNLTATMNIRPTIYAGLPVGDAVSLDGSVTITVSMI